MHTGGPRRPRLPVDQRCMRTLRIRREPETLADDGSRLPEMSRLVECAEHDVIAVGIAQCKLPGPRPGIHAGLLFEGVDQSACPPQRIVKIIHPKEQEQPVARFRTVGAGQGRMVMLAPRVEAKQDRAIRVEQLPPVVMRRLRFRLTEQRLVPLEAARNVGNTNDGPCAFHGILPGSTPGSGTTRRRRSGEVLPFDSHEAGIRRWAARPAPAPRRVSIVAPTCSFSPPDSASAAMPVPTPPNPPTHPGSAR